MNCNKIRLLFFWSILSLFVFSCGGGDSKVAKTEESEENVETIEEKEEVPFSLNFPQISYQIVELKSRAMIDSIRNKYKEKGATVAAAYTKALRTLNRKELRFWAVGQTVVVPDVVLADMRAYSIFPDEYVGAKKLPQIIIVDNQYQAYACYEYGRLVRFAATNTGKERTPTFPGRYALVWRQRLRLSSLDSNWVMPFCVNFHRYAGNAMHEFEMPGRPVSHSCLRQFSDDAEWIYNWGNLAKYDDSNRVIPFSGTPLIILNTFDFSRPRGGPWLELKSNKAYYVKLPEDPMKVEEALIPWGQIPISSRGVVTPENKKRHLYAEDTLRARGIIRQGVVLIETVDFNKKRREEKLKKEKEEKLKQQQLKQQQQQEQEMNEQNVEINE